MTDTALFLSVFTPLFFIGCAIYFVKKNGGRRKKTAFGVSLVNLTQLAVNGELDVVSGREKEIDRVIHIVMRRTKNNPLLIGQPGVGKTALVEGLAQRIAKGDVPETLKEKQILSLDLTSLISDTKYRGEMEDRLRKMLIELMGFQGKAILFIDEIHMLEQIGGAEGSLNVSDILKPTLARGEVQVIGATTWNEYANSIQKDLALDRRFQPVIVDEPSPEDALRMLEHVQKLYEQFHGVHISKEALEAAVTLSSTQIKNRYLPDKAIDVIDEACAKVAIEFSEQQHGAPLGLLHGASRDGKAQVTVEDVQEVIREWIPHQTHSGA